MTFDLAFTARIAGIITTFIESPAACKGDIDSNGQLEPNDVMDIFLGGGCTRCNENVNGNGTTGSEDVIVVLAVWGPCTG